MGCDVIYNGGVDMVFLKVFFLLTGVSLMLISRTAGPPAWFFCAGDGVLCLLLVLFMEPVRRSEREEDEDG